MSQYVFRFRQRLANPRIAQWILTLSYRHTENNVRFPMVTLGVRDIVEFSFVTSVPIQRSPTLMVKGRGWTVDELNGAHECHVRWHASTI